MTEEERQEQILQRALKVQEELTENYQYKRQQYYTILEASMDTSNIFLIGPRRCGKTVVLKQLHRNIQNSEYIDFKVYDDVLRLKYYNRIIDSIKSNKKIVYLLDEITYMVKPDTSIDYISELFSEYNNTNTHIVYTGSQSTAIRCWCSRAFGGSAKVVQMDFLSYKEWLTYKNIQIPTVDNYNDYLIKSQDFCKVQSAQEYLQGCLDETIISNSKASEYIFGNDCNLLDVDVLLDVCYATLFTLHNHVTKDTFMKKDYLRDNLIYYFSQCCDKEFIDKAIKDSFIYHYSRFKKRDLETLCQAFIFLNKCNLITITPVISDLSKVPDMRKEFNLMISDKVLNQKLRDNMFIDYNFTINHTVFYVAILQDILGDKLQSVSNPLLGSLVECSCRYITYNDFVVELHIEDREIDYVDTIRNIAMEFKTTDRTHNYNFPELQNFKKYILTKSKREFDKTTNTIYVPYYEFIANIKD